MRDDTMLQIADVIVAEHVDTAGAAQWTARILVQYPGCLAAVAVAADHSWVLIRIRGAA
ncbi:hypothetical protein JOF56_000390 [Kibdelosporangium banguiense]|uniref:Uncharacterized protein n=1 Tax=Kibdelosporangium banguiense TaxID=1365924 RepID=A0ABS4T6F4_9PSEU|nr:hypothetical protein [Kibdelosporangium banguiense]MBP2320005.1 hypothetical protein [Kibdelosporangium banguiense]